MQSCQADGETDDPAQHRKLAGNADTVAFSQSRANSREACFSRSKTSLHDDNIKNCGGGRPRTTGQDKQLPPSSLLTSRSERGPVRVEWRAFRDDRRSLLLGDNAVFARELVDRGAGELPRRDLLRKEDVELACRQNKVCQRKVGHTFREGAYRRCVPSARGNGSRSCRRKVVRMRFRALLRIGHVPEASDVPDSTEGTCATPKETRSFLK